MIRHIFLCIIGLLFVYLAPAQIPQQPMTVPSPNAWAFTQYGKVDVSHFTGLPSIQVPLHRTTFKNHAVNMALSYNASGFRPDMHASWVGTGWSLGVGGVVTRQVNGLPDEFSYTLTNTCNCVGGLINGRSETFNLGTLKGGIHPDYSLSVLANGTSHYINTNYSVPAPDISTNPNWVKYPFPVPYRGQYWGPSCFMFDRFWKGEHGAAPDPITMADNSFITGTKDLQRDEFQFNVEGYTGKFFINYYNNVEIVSEHNFKVTVLEDEIDIPSTLLQPNSSPHAGSTCPQWITGFSPWKAHNKYPKTLRGFAITAEDGTTFIFGNYSPFDDDAIEYSIGENYTPGEAGHGSQSFQDYWVANAWYLTRIVYPDNKSVRFGYQRAEYIRSLFTSEFYYGVSQNAGSCGSGTQPYATTGNTTGARIISPVYLKDIYSDLLKVQFSWSNTGENSNLTTNAIQDFKWKKLDEISISSINGEKCKWKFAYFPLSNWSQRLFLQSVERFTQSDVSLNEKFSFEYDSSLVLPAYNVNSNDHWGFWNGTQMTSVFLQTNETIDAARQPNYSRTKAGVLTKVTFPTGGYNEFFYEQNSYSRKVKEQRHLGVDVLGLNKLAGGLRVKEIIAYDPIASNTQSVEYFYVEGYTPSLTPTQISQLPSSGVLNQYAFIYQWENVVSNMYTWASCQHNVRIQLTSNQPMNAAYDDYHIGYSTIIEKYQDGSYKKYTYTNYDNGHSDDEPVASINPFSSPYNRYSSRDMERGKLSREESYSNSNKLMMQVDNEYTIVGRNANQESKSYLYELTFNVVDVNQVIIPGGSPTPIVYGYIPMSYIFSTRYKEYTYRYLNTKKTTKLYDQRTNSYLTTEETIAYGSIVHGQPVMIRQKESGGKISSRYFKYAADYTPGQWILDRLNNSGGKILPIEIIETIKENENAEEKVVAATLNEFYLNPISSANIPLVKNVYKLAIKEPISLSSYVQATPTTYSFQETGVWPKDSRYIRDVQYSRYDDYHNVLEVFGKDGIRQAVTYGYNGVKISSSFNLGESTAHGRLLYTGFEYDESFDPFDISYKRVYDGDGWTYSGDFYSTVKFSGEKAFSGIVRSSLGSSVIYINVFALSSGAAPTVHAVQSDGSLSSGSTGTVILEKNGWKLYRFVTTTPSGRFAVNSNNNLIDHLYCVPLGGESNHNTINTYTYKDGRLTSEIDPDLRFKYYEYDPIGRLIHILDEEKNILKKFEYKIQY